MRWLVALMLVMLSSVVLSADESNRFIKKVELPSGQTVVVAEGDFEARSIGSFSVRLYEASSPVDMTTFFAAGVICSRDGTIEKVELVDVDDNSGPELIVFVRSAGSGGYRSAYAFVFEEKTLVLRAVVEDLPRESDPVSDLRKTIL